MLQVKNKEENLCEECKFWIVFYQDKYGKDIYSCRLGEKPKTRNDSLFCMWYKDAPTR